MMINDARTVLNNNSILFKSFFRGDLGCVCFSFKKNRFCVKKI